jgi:RNA polymerase sigma-70 factor (ECF subfamily)
MTMGAVGPATDLAADANESPMGSPAHDLVVQLYEELRDPVCRYLAVLGAPPPAVDDLCQDAFLRLFQALRNGQRVANPRAWIFTVAHNSGLNARAVQARMRELDENADWPGVAMADPELAILDDERLAKIHRAVEGLPPHQRNCLNLRAEGFRYREIAEIMGVSISAVAGSLRRTVLRIREAIHE